MDNKTFYFGFCVWLFVAVFFTVIFLSSMLKDWWDGKNDAWEMCPEFLMMTFSWPVLVVTAPFLFLIDLFVKWIEKHRQIHIEKLRAVRVLEEEKKETLSKESL